MQKPIEIIRMNKNLRILFITGATHKKYMKNLNHFQRVYFLSRWTQLTILAAQGADFSCSAAKGTKAFHSPWRGKFGHLIFCLYWLITSRRKNDFDIILTEPSVLSICGFFYKLLWKTKWVVDVWDIPIRCQSHSRILRMKSKVQRKIFKQLYQFADLFLVSILPDFEFKDFAIPKDKMILLSNAIWPIDKSKSKIKDSASQKFKIFSARSRFTPDTGLDVLAKAFKMLNNKIPDAELILVGQIPANILAQIKILNNMNNVRHYEFLEHEVLLNEMHKASVCVIPFHNVPDLAQTFPVKLIEYLAIGAVTVVSDISGMKTMLKNMETGLLFKAGNPQDLAEKLMMLYENKKLRKELSENAIKSVNQHYNCRKKNNTILKKLSNLANNH